MLLLIGLVSFLSIDSLSVTNERVDHTHKVIGKAMLIEGSAVDMETGMRGYLLSGKDDFLEPYTNGKKRFYERVSELKKTVSDNPAQVTLLEDIQENITNWQTNVTESAIDLRRTIGDAKTMNDIADVIGKAKGKKYFDKFRGQVATFIERESKLLKSRRAKSKKTTSVSDIKKTMNWVDHTHIVIAKALQIESAAVDMETGMRGYLLAGKDIFLEPYENGKKKFTKLVNKLKETVDDNSAQVTLLGEMSATIENWQDDVTESMISLRRSIGESKNMDDMANLIGEARGKKYFDKFRSQISTFRDRELKLMKERQAAAVSNVFTTKLTLVGGIIIAIILSVFVSLFISKSIAKRFQNIFKGLTDFSDKELDELNVAFGDIVSKMSVSAGKVGSVAGQISSVSNNLSKLSQQQAASVEETSASVEEIAGMVKNNVTIAQDSRDLSSNVGEKMEGLNIAMTKIAESNQKIEDLVKIIGEIGTKTEVIDEIVFQTKLLSFNASVEAERAGEHGRGFAVVAQEVGNLAQMSGKAALEISSIVKESVSQAEGITKENTKRVSEGEGLVKETHVQSETLSSSANDIYAASNEQSKGVNEIATAIESINKGTQHVANISDNAANSSNELSREATLLNQQVSILNGFLKGHSNIESPSSIKEVQHNITPVNEPKLTNVVSMNGSNGTWHTNVDLNNSEDSKEWAKL